MNGFQSDAEESFRALLAKYGFVWVWKKKKYQEERHLKLPHTTSSSSLTSGMESSLSSEEFKNLWKTSKANWKIWILDCTYLIGIYALLELRYFNFEGECLLASFQSVKCIIYIF